MDPKWLRTWFAGLLEDERKILFVAGPAGAVLGAGRPGIDARSEPIWESHTIGVHGRSGVAQGSFYFRLGGLACGWLDRAGQGAGVVRLWGRNFD